MPSNKTSKLTSATVKKPRYFYGWNIVAASFLARLSYAEQHSSLLGFFFKPLQGEFGWSRSAIGAVQSLARVSEAVTAPLIGRFIDQYGARVLMPIGAVVVGLAMLAATQVSAIWQFYMLRGVIVAVGFTLMGGLVTSVAISNWFVRKRGRALAIANMGTNISNVLMTPLTVLVLAASGWRTMFVVFAVTTWLVVLIPSTILMRRRPEDMNLHPDGTNPDMAEQVSQQGASAGVPSAEAAALAPEPVWTRREALMTGAFWVLTICFAIESLAFQGTNISLVPYMQDLGYRDAVVATVTIFRASVMAAMSPLMGFLAEHAHKARFRAMPFIILGASALFFLWAGEPAFLWLAVTLYALGFAGATIMQEVLWANYFGRASLGTIRSLGFLTTFGFGAAGPIAMNAVFDVLGSYRPAFAVIAGLFALSGLLIAVARPPKVRRYAKLSDRP